MKTRAIHAVLCLALFFALSCPAAAVDVGVSFVIDGVEIEKEIATQTVNQTVYVSYWPIVEALYPDAQTQWANGQAEVRAEGVDTFLTPEKKVLPDLFGGLQNWFFTGPSGEQIELLQML